MEKRIKFFGILRKFGDASGFYHTSISENMSVEKLKTQLKQELSQKFQNFDAAIIDESAFASDSEVLTAQAMIPVNAEIALLPPVCGG